MDKNKLEHLMKNASKLQKSMDLVQKKLKMLEMCGFACGGLITFRLDGKLDGIAIEISPKFFEGKLPEELIKSNDFKNILEELADVILIAYQDVKKKVEANVQEEMSAVTGPFNF